MSWNDSIFNDDRSPLDSWQNRDSDTHLHIVDDLGYTRDDLRPIQELSNWEKDLINASFDNYDKGGKN